MLAIRGAIQNRKRAKQLRDYSGLRFDNITPTDIDGLIEYHGKGYIIIETKLRDTPLGFGQRLALERLTDDLTKAHKSTLCLITTHNIGDPERDIDMANTIVAEYRFNGQWRIPESDVLASQMVEWFLNNKLNRNYKTG